MDLHQHSIPPPITMRLLGHENTSTTSAFHAFATLDTMRDAINAATPTITTAPAEQLTEQTLQALYDLRQHQSLSRGIRPARPHTQTRPRSLGLTQTSA